MHRRHPIIVAIIAVAIAPLAADISDYPPWEWNSVALTGGATFMFDGNGSAEFDLEIAMPLADLSQIVIDANVGGAFDPGGFVAGGFLAYRQWTQDGFFFDLGVGYTALWIKPATSWLYENETMFGPALKLTGGIMLPLYLEYYMEDPDSGNYIGLVGEAGCVLGYESGIRAGLLLTFGMQLGFR